LLLHRNYLFLWQRLHALAEGNAVRHLNYNHLLYF